MMPITIKLYQKIFLSFLIASLLVSIPLPKFLYLIWPQWVVLVLIFWTLNVTKLPAFVVAFVVGLFLDALNGSVLGEHSLALVIITYFLIKFGNKFNFSSTLSQIIVIFLSMLIYQGVLFWIFGVINNSTPASAHWLTCITSAFAWLLVASILNRQVRKFSRRGQLAQN